MVGRELGAAEGVARGDRCCEGNSDNDRGPGEVNGETYADEDAGPEDRSETQRDSADQADGPREFCVLQPGGAPLGQPAEAIK